MSSFRHCPLLAFLVHMTNPILSAAVSAESLMCVSRVDRYSLNPIAK